MADAVSSTVFHRPSPRDGVIQWAQVIVLERLRHGNGQVRIAVVHRGQGRCHGHVITRCCSVTRQRFIERWIGIVHQGDDLINSLVVATLIDSIPSAHHKGHSCATVNQSDGIRVGDFHFGVAVVRGFGSPKASNAVVVVARQRGILWNHCEFRRLCINQINRLNERVAVSAEVRCHIGAQVTSGAGTAELLVGEELQFYRCVTVVADRSIEGVHAPVGAGDVQLKRSRDDRSSGVDHGHHLNVRELVSSTIAHTPSAGDGHVLCTVSTFARLSKRHFEVVVTIVRGLQNLRCWH